VPQRDHFHKYFAKIRIHEEQLFLMEKLRQQFFRAHILVKTVHGALGINHFGIGDWADRGVAYWEAYCG
jgi:hypothetical protein